MSYLPVELVRDIVESSAHHSMVSDAQWVGQSLAIASRAVYAWVAPILFESCYITPAKLDAFNELVSSGGLPGVAYALTFIADDRDRPTWTTATRRTWLASLDCSKLQVVAGTGAIFEQLCAIPQFRPRVVHLRLCEMTYLPLPRATLQSVFSRITHICVETISSFECDFDMAGYFPEVTHIIIQVFFGSSIIALRRILAELPKLRRILLGAYPLPPDPPVLSIVGQLATLGDKRVYHGWNLERVTSIDLNDWRTVPHPTYLARLARDGQDIWSEGEPVVPQASG